MCNICYKICFDKQLKKVESKLIYEQYKCKKLSYSKEVTLYGVKNDIDSYSILSYLILLTNIENYLLLTLIC